MTRHPILLVQPGPMLQMSEEVLRACHVASTWAEVALSKGEFSLPHEMTAVELRALGDQFRAVLEAVQNGWGGGVPRPFREGAFAGPGKVEPLRTRLWLEPIGLAWEDFAVVVRPSLMAISALKGAFRSMLEQFEEDMELAAGIASERSTFERCAKWFQGLDALVHLEVDYGYCSGVAGRRLASDESEGETDIFPGHRIESLPGTKNSISFAGYGPTVRIDRDACSILERATCFAFEHLGEGQTSPSGFRHADILSLAGQFIAMEQVFQNSASLASRRFLSGEGVDPITHEPLLDPLRLDVVCLGHDAAVLRMNRFIVHTLAWAMHLWSGRSSESASQPAKELELEAEASILAALEILQAFYG